VKDAIYTEMKVWGKMIANADINDPLIFGRQISAFSSLWKCMKDEPEMISMISKVSHTTHETNFRRYRGSICHFHQEHLAISKRAIRQFEQEQDKV